MFAEDRQLSLYDRYQEEGQVSRAPSFDCGPDGTNASDIASADRPIYYPEFSLIYAVLRCLKVVNRVSDLKTTVVLKQ